MNELTEIIANLNRAHGEMERLKAENRLALARIDALTADRDALMRAAKMALEVVPNPIDDCDCERCAPLSKVVTALQAALRQAGGEK